MLLPLPVLAFFAIVSRSSPILQQVSTQMSGAAVEGLFLLVYYGPLLPLTLLIPLLVPGLHNHPAANGADLRTSEPHDPTNSGGVTPARHLQDAHAGSGPRIARATLVGWVRGGGAAGGVPGCACAVTLPGRAPFSVRDPRRLAAR